MSTASDFPTKTLCSSNCFIFLFWFCNQKSLRFLISFLKFTTKQNMWEFLICRQKHFATKGFWFPFTNKNTWSWFSEKKYSTLHELLIFENPVKFTCWWHLGTFETSRILGAYTAIKTEYPRTLTLVKKQLHKIARGEVTNGEKIWIKPEQTK